MITPAERDYLKMQELQKRIKAWRRRAKRAHHALEKLERSYNYYYNKKPKGM